jgi:hypothetical protein
MLLLLILRSLAFLFVSPPPPPSDDGESESTDESLPPSPEHRVIAAPPPLPPKLYANQEDWPGCPDHPDRQTCQLAGSVGHYRCSPRRPCRRPRPSAIDISPQITLPVCATNGHGHGDIALSWEQDFDWNSIATAAGHEWSQDNWVENVGAAAAADNLYNYMEE